MMESRYNNKDNDDDDVEKALLLSNNNNQNQNEDDDEQILLYSASFLEAEDDFIKLKTAQWILYSFLFIFAWGFGFLMLLYLPIRRYILRRITRSRQLSLTPHSILYKVTKPLPFPCFGVFTVEKHILLPSVSDVIIQQGYLQSRYGVYSIRIDNVGVTRPPSDSLQIEGIVDPQAFREAVFTRLSNIRNQDVVVAGSSTRMFRSPLLSPLKSRHDDYTLSRDGEFAVLQKLEEVGSSLKRVQSLIEDRQPKPSQSQD